MTRSPFSASNLQRRVLCPGSLAMERGLPDVRTDDSAEGTLLHFLAADSSQSRDELEPEQLAVLELNDQMQEEFIAFVKREHSLRDPEAQTLVEQEWWYHRGGKRLFAMHPDKVLVWPTVIIVLDSKFGREPVPAPNVNWQLKSYACGAHEQYPKAELIYCAITQPRISRKIQSCCYSPADILHARQEIEQTWDLNHDPKAKRVPSMEACRYCRGFTLGVCQEARNLALSVQAAGSSALSTSPEIVLSKMDPKDRPRLFEAFAMAAHLKDTYTKAAKVLMAKDPEFIPGWKLVPGGERETVTDPLMLFNRLTALGTTPNEFIEVCSVPKKHLTELLRTKTGLKGKSLLTKLEETLDGVVDKTPIAPSLERAAQ